jgi:hypothetical protein
VSFLSHILIPRFPRFSFLSVAFYFIIYNLFRYSFVGHSVQFIYPLSSASHFLSFFSTYLRFLMWSSVVSAGFKCS